MHAAAISCLMQVQVAAGQQLYVAAWSFHAAAVVRCSVKGPSLFIEPSCANVKRSMSQSVDSSRCDERRKSQSAVVVNAQLVLVASNIKWCDCHHHVVGDIRWIGFMLIACVGASKLVGMSVARWAA
jgi:hypothetical protein